jgi:hypothetical protein
VIWTREIVKPIARLAWGRRKRTTFAPDFRPA